MRPRILIAYANDRGSSLRLSQEAAEIQDALSGAACDLILAPAANLDRIFRAFDTYKDSIQVFHYAGHANEYALELLDKFGRQQTVAGNSFSNYLANPNKALKLVFLNACSTWAQAEDLRDKGIPYVIATSQDIADGQAVNFAKSFYESLAQGYTIPKSHSEALSKIGLLPAGGGESRGIPLAEIGNGEAGSWRIYESPNLPEALKYWKLEKNLNLPQERLPENWHLRCNREQQSAVFESLFIQPVFYTPRVCLLAGELDSRHQSLISRFENDINTKKEAERLFGGLKQISAWPAVSAVNRKESLPLLTLKAFFGMSALRPGARLDKAEALVGQLRPNSVYLACQEIDCREWDDSNTEDLRWYIEEFWQVAIQNAEQENKKLFVFLNLIMPEKSGFLSRFRKSPLDKLMENLEQDAKSGRAPHLTCFPHLGPVELYQVEKFLKNDTSLQRRGKDAQAILRKFFAGRKAWKMYEVETLLQQIANEVNTTGS